MTRSILLAIGLAGCQGDYGIQRDRVEPADPPGAEEDPLGSPPDWQNCFEGWRGQYSNLTVHDDFVDPGPLEIKKTPLTPDAFDYWVDSSFETYDPTLDFGQNWWPVDEDLEEDPKYFAVYWHAWLRAWSSTTVEISLGSQDDAWVHLDSTPIVENPGIHEFERESYRVDVDGGQYPIEVWFAHRGSDDSGFSFRVVSGDVSICYPDFGTGSGTTP
jgi:PA14 domain